MDTDQYLRVTSALVQLGKSIRAHQHTELAVYV